MKKNKMSKRSKSQPVKNMKNKFNIYKLSLNELNNDNKSEFKKYNTLRISTNLKKEARLKHKNKINSINEDTDLSYITKKDSTVSFNY